MLPALERLDTLAEVQALCAGGEVVEIQKQVDRLLQKAMGETESAIRKASQASQASQASPPSDFWWAALRAACAKPC